jgi:hypothetical protein
MLSTFLRPAIQLNVFLAVLLVLSRAGFAATLNVTDLGDSGAPGQLRTLINEAAPGDTIMIPAGIITLTGVPGEDENAGGDLDILKDLTIQGAGPGPGVTTIHGGAIDRVFDIIGDVAVTIRDLTITGGSAGDNSSINFGGGIFNDGGRLSVVNCVVSANSTIEFGGGIANLGGTLTVTGSTLSGNFADFGSGGIDNFAGTLTVTNSIVTGNTAGGFGGGMGNFGGTLTVTNSTLSANVAAGDSGGIDNEEGTLTVTNSIVTGNTAGGFGGGIRNLGGTLTVTGSTLSGNFADFDGGGIDNEGGVLFLTNSTVSGNTAGGFGGGMGDFEGTVIITNSTLSGNAARGDGGGISEAGGGTTELKNVTITNNAADSDSDGIGDGGGVSNSDGTVNLKNTMIAGNTDAGGQGPDCFGTLASQGFNLIQSTTGCSIGGVTTGNVTGVSPNLGPLSSNGGPTQTHALLPGSPAIDTGDTADCPSTDQRGIVRPQDGNGDGSALCDIGAYEVASGSAPRLTNLSTRAQVGLGPDQVIAGVIIEGSAPMLVLLRALGPSLTGLGVPGALANPILQLFSGQTLLAQNDDWQTQADPTCAATGHTCGDAAAITATGLAPPHPQDAALLITLPPGTYTVIVSGAGGLTGVGLVEVYEVGGP